MNCENCKNNNAVPFIAFESAKATTERTIKRLWIVVILLIFLLFGSNAAWIFYESQWEVTEKTVTCEAENDGSGIAVAIGGDVTYHG